MAMRKRGVSELRMRLRVEGGVAFVVTDVATTSVASRSSECARALTSLPSRDLARLSGLTLELDSLEWTRVRRQGGFG